MLRVYVGGKLRAFGDHHDTEIKSTGVTQANGFRDLLDIEGLLGDEDDVGATGDAAIHGDPAGVTAHDFDHHHAIMGLGGRVHAVDRFGGDVHGSIESEGEVGAGQVVVNGLGDADDFDAFLVQ